MSLLEGVKLITPLAVAFVAAALALLANRSLDRGRAKRDFITKIGESLRDDVRQAVEAAADYWGPTPSGKSILEARIKMLEQEIRSAAVILAEDKNCKEGSEFTSSLNSFLSVLTGADFESAKVTANQVQIRDVTGRGVALRKATAQYRRAQLAK